MEDSSNSLIDGEFDAADKDGFSLIDGSELDDLFVSMSEPRLVDNRANIVDGGVSMLQRSEAEKPKRNEKYNLRKSLAWDSAFFTSAGVLDAEELSSIMDGGNGGKHQLQHLPGIQEDISKSTDSFSTLESDNLTLESLEADLFSDIRASIQRSGESSNLRKTNLNGRLEQTSQLRKKTTEVKLGNMVKPKSTPKKLNTNLQGDGKLMKSGPSREPVKNPVGSKRESNSSLLKPAAASGKGSSTVLQPAKVQTKRMPVSAGRIKPDNCNVGNEMAAGRVASVSKSDRPGGPRSIIPKAASYAKSSSISSAATRPGISSSRSSYDSTSSSSSQSSRILPLNGIPGKSNKPASIIPPGMKSRIPCRVPMNGTNPPSTSRKLGKLSASMLSPSISPSSSISEWSSCSSTVTANQEHSASRDCSSLHRTFSLDSNASQDLQIRPNPQASCGDETETAGVPDISAQDLSARNISISNPVSAKPSGLRMPSPKIGFFDGVKTGGRTQNAVGTMQSRSRLSSSRVPRSTTGSSSPNGVPNKSRSGNATVKLTALAAQNTNSDTRRSYSRMAAAGGGHLEGIQTAVKESTVTVSEENTSTAVKLRIGEKHRSDSGSSLRKKTGGVCSSKNATPLGKTQLQGIQVSIAVEADRHIKDISVDSIELDTLLLDEPVNGGAVNTELQSINMYEDVGNAIVIDENAGAVQFGECEVTAEKNDPIFTLINMSEEAGIALKVDVNTINVDENADEVVECGEFEVTAVKNDPICTLINMSDEEAAIASRADVNADEVVQSGEFEVTAVKNDPVCTLINLSEEEEDIASRADVNADEVVQSGEFEVTSVKNVPICTLIKMSEEEADIASRADVNADEVVQSGECEITSEKNDPICNLINMSEEEAGIANKVDANADWDEVGNTVIADKNADAVVVSGECESINETNDPVCAVINMSEEKVGIAIEADVNADSGVQSGKFEAAIEKNDPLFAVINISEVVNAVNSDENADTVVVSGGCESSSERNDPICDGLSMSEGEVGNAKKVDENVDRVCGVMTDKQNVFAEQKTVEASKPCARTPFADKNSSSNAFSVDVLVKKFTSLSIDNI